MNRLIKNSSNQQSWLTLLFFDLRELELDRRRPAKNKDANLQATLIVVDLFHHAIEIGKGTIDNTHGLTWLEHGLGARLVSAIFHTMQNGIRFFLRNRSRLFFSTTDKAHDTRGLVDQVPTRIIHLHLDQHIAGIELALTLAALTVAHLNDFFRRHQDLTKAILHAVHLHTLLKRTHNMLLKAGVGVYDVPTLGHEDS